METKRQKLKVEHDHMSDRLNQIVANLSAEERACERISVQVRNLDTVERVKERKVKKKKSKEFKSCKRTNSLFKTALYLYLQR